MTLRNLRRRVHELESRSCPPERFAEFIREYRETGNVTAPRRIKVEIVTYCETIDACFAEQDRVAQANLKGGGNVGIVEDEA